MTYRHIYTDPNPCACDSHATEPTAGGDGRKCMVCGTYRPDAFDPDRDPFNPEREGWTGWVKRDASGHKWCHESRDATWDVVSGSRLTAISRSEVYGGTPHGHSLNRRVIYKAEFIPHRTVVSILVSNGHVPEVVV